jgi:small subunit ribosomal protein S20
MPQRKCAAKRLRIDKKRKAHNLELKNNLKKELKGLRALIAQGKKDEASKRIPQAFSLLDRAVTKGLIHKNTAARRKSRLVLTLNKTT